MADFYPWNIADFVVLTLLCYVAYRWVVSRCSTPLPPGPKGLPLLGNSYQIPARKQWLKFDEWIKEYGLLCPSSTGLVSLRPVRRRSRLYQHPRSTDADRWFDRSSQRPTRWPRYASAVTILPRQKDRQGMEVISIPIVPWLSWQVKCEPSIPVAHQASLIPASVGWDRGLGYAPGPHNPRFREFRKLFSQYIGPKACNDPHILGLQEKESRRLACRLLYTPERFMKHFRRRDLSFSLTSIS